MSEVDTSNWKEKLEAHFEEEDIKPKAGGVRYITQEAVTQRLNEVWGHEWSSQYLDRWETGKTQFVLLRLTAPNGKYHDEVGSGTASSAQDDTLWKEPFSDALKRCAMRFGVALYIYLEEGEKKRNERKNKRQPTQAQQNGADQREARTEATEHDEGATGPQLTKINAMAKYVVSHKEQNFDIHVYAGVKSLKELSKQQASDLITGLQKEFQIK